MNRQFFRAAYLHLSKEISIRHTASAGCSGCCISRHISSSSQLYKGKKNKSNPAKEKSDDISDTLKDAAKSVAESLPGDRKKTESTLLQQLRTHAKLSRAQKEERETTAAPSSVDIGNVLSGMRIQKEEKRSADFRQRRQDGTGQGKRRDTKRINEMTLYGGSGLGIFTKKATPEKAVDVNKRKSLWDEMEEEQRDLLRIRPPGNAFEEMIKMTKEGKLWTFPINNEAGMSEEQSVGFQEHIFFDQLLTDFPRKGPIHIFMELVTTGLSKNPYLSVRQKHEHIEWFRQYFSAKQEVLQENIGEEGVMRKIKDNQLQ